jgi:serine/threonine protein kinase
VTLPAPDKTSILHSGATLPGSEPRPLPLGEPTQIGRYRLIGSLGEGGQGAVYLGETPEGTRVAIKVLHARLASEGNARQRFLREVEAARRVAPFSTARVIDADVSDDRLFIVSEYVEGASLEQLVRERGPRSQDGLVRLALGTSGALAAIHRAGIVHRDFKPSNVLIGADGPRVVDFGIARVLDNATATSSGALGTPAYMSPEQVSGERVGPPSDIFSWAGTIVFAATGKPAFGEDNIAAVFNRIFTKQPDLSALPGSLAEVIGTCLDKKPENRPTASDVMLAIVQ